MPAIQTLPIELFFWPTPNGHKISILLEELAVPYTLRFIHIGKGEQFTPEFLAVSPNNRIPAIVDPEGPDGGTISIFESAAIMIYLGDKFGRFYGKNPRERVTINEWLAWQVANVGPVFGHYNHFLKYAKEQVPYAIKRFGDETYRLYRVLNDRLRDRDFVAGDYSIADMALFGWVRNWKNRDIDIANFPNVEAWHDKVASRPAVIRAVALKAPVELDVVNNEEARKVLFGQR